MINTKLAMFNPLEKFDSRLIDAFRNKGERYLVSQTYRQGLDDFWEPGKESLLLTHYAGLELAAFHVSMIREDKYKALIDLEKENHRTRIFEILRHDSKYVVYSSLIGDRKRVEKRANHTFKANIFRYIRRYTSWMIQPHEVLEPHLKLLYGEFLVSIERFGEQIQMKLTDLENT